MPPRTCTSTGSKGWKPVGSKIGFTNRTLWDRYGVHEPMWGTVYDRTLIQAENQRATVPLEGWFSRGSSRRSRSS